MTDDALEAPVNDEPTPAVGVDDRTLRLNEAAIGDVRRQVSAAVSDIDRALTRLREVLDSRLPELRLPDSPEGGAP